MDQPSENPATELAALGELTNLLGERLAVLERLSPGILAGGLTNAASGAAVDVLRRLGGHDRTTAATLVEFLWPPPGQPPRLLR